jgi:small GTP-binding protein
MIKEKLTMKIIKSMTLDDFRKITWVKLLKDHCEAITKKIKNNRDYQWVHDGRVVFRLNVLFIGQTGTGKSSTINRIIGKKYMLTTHVECCTKEVSCVEYELGGSCYLCFCDMPGIGEGREVDKAYVKWYKEMVSKSECVVYLMRADKRDYRVDLEMFNRLKRMGCKKKVIVALNCVDKLPPSNRDFPFQLSEAQMANLNEKISDVCGVFKLSSDKVVPISANENYNIKELKQKISETLLLRLGLQPTTPIKLLSKIFRNIYFFGK